MSKKCSLRPLQWSWERTESLGAISRYQHLCRTRSTFLDLGIFPVRTSSWEPFALWVGSISARLLLLPFPLFSSLFFLLRVKNPGKYCCCRSSEYHALRSSEAITSTRAPRKRKDNTTARNVLLPRPPQVPRLQRHNRARHLCFLFNPNPCNPEILFSFLFGVEGWRDRKEMGRGRGEGG